MSFFEGPTDRLESCFQPALELDKARLPKLSVVCHGSLQFLTRDHAGIWQHFLRLCDERSRADEVFQTLCKALARRGLCLILGIDEVSVGFDLFSKLLLFLLLSWRKLSQLCLLEEMTGLLLYPFAGF